MNFSHLRRAASLFAASVVALASLAGNASAAERPPAPTRTSFSDIFSCPRFSIPGLARCHARVRTDAGAQPKATGGPSGYAPADLWSAYNVPTGNSGQLVAIVDAYDDPRAEADLAVYRSQFGLPACTTANGCFRKVDQRGGTAYPAPNGGWAQEISLDLDMVSAICPNCHILLVESDTNSYNDLGMALNQAVRMGAKVVSNGYGGGEFAAESFYATSYSTILGSPW